MTLYYLYKQNLKTMFKQLILAISILLISESLFAQKVHTFILPDGKTVSTWNDETNYSKTYHVSRNHPDASDNNPGTFDKPFKTINKAARVVKAGEKILVYSGVYREQVNPVNEGMAKDKMISYEKASGNKVIVKGTQIFNEKWVWSRDKDKRDWAHNVWQAPLDEAVYTPFYIENASVKDIELMPWAVRWKGRVPYSLGRGIVFQNDKRLRQLAMLEDISFINGSYWIDKDQKLIHIHPFDDVDPNGQQFEFTIHQQLFVPEKTGLSYIRVSGFIFEQAGNGYPRVGTGAVFAKGGDHWIIENNIVRQCGSVGIEIGARMNESRAATKKENDRVKAHTGGFIVRNNEVYECGTGGIEGHTNRNSVISHNHIHHIGWQHVERYHECAGIKILVNTNVVAAWNTFHDIEEASAIWFDWDNRNCRITRNVIYDIGKNRNGTLYLEASIEPNMIDNNLIWNVEGPGVSLNDTDLSLVYHNLIGYANVAVASRINTDRSIRGKKLTSKDNSILNNIFYHNRAQMIIENKENLSDYNVFAGDDLQLQHEAGFDKNSKQLHMELKWCPDSKTMTMITEDPFPVVPGLENCKSDFYGHERSEKEIIPGLWNVKVVGKAGFSFDIQ